MGLGEFAEPREVVVSESFRIFEGFKDRICRQNLSLEFSKPPLHTPHRCKVGHDMLGGFGLSRPLSPETTTLWLDPTTNTHHSVSSQKGRKNCGKLTNNHGPVSPVGNGKHMWLHSADRLVAILHHGLI